MLVEPGPGAGLVSGASGVRDNGRMAGRGARRPGEPDWARWVARWEAQQAAGVPRREERFGVMIDLVRVMAGEAPVVLDLGSGPGSLAVRVCDRLPKARVVAVDGDPLLLEMGRRGHGDRGGRIAWVEADLRQAGWEAGLGLEGVDAALSTTALHWLAPEEAVRLCVTLARLLRPGGVFVNGDHMTFDAGEGALAAAAAALRAEPAAPGAETWQQWWEAVEQEPGLTALTALRRQRWGGHPDHHSRGEPAFWRAALIRAGFSEASFAWQWLEDRVLVGVR